MTAEPCYLCGAGMRKRYAATLDPQKERYLITEQRVGKHGSLWFCPQCRLLSVVRAQRELLAELPDATDEVYLREEQGRRRGARKLLERIERRRPRGSLLDIGCSTGFFLDEAQKKGWDTCGIEFSAWSRKIAQERFGLRVYDRPLGELTLPIKAYDLVTMIDLIEHLPDPRAVLHDVRNVLKPGGGLVVTTMNVASPVARIFGERWYAVLPGHLFYFSGSTLRTLLEQSGFQVIRLRHAYPRYFTIEYLLFRLGGYLPLLARAGRFLPGGLRKATIKVNFFDHLEVYAVRKNA